jgi:hypothetical protein
MASLKLLLEVGRGTSRRYRNFNALVAGLCFGCDADMEM